MSVERIELGQVKHTKIEVEEVQCRTVTIRDEAHAKANHYIKQSREYFPHEKLPIYIDCPYFLKLARAFCLASVLGIWKVSGGSVIMQVVLFVGCLAFLTVYGQHELVNQRSLPTVLKQPIFAGQKSTNNFYEVTVTDLEGIALQNYQAGVGFVSVSQGKIKFQAFNKTAKKYMRRAICNSRLMMALFSVGAVYNCYFLVIYS